MIEAPIKDGSTAIEEISYNGNKSELTVEFTTYGRYVYEDVPRNIASAVLKAKSLGRAFHTFIKGNYSYTRVA